jgi:predicted pyridoxine 5'-phosphate oxidase superfamily flavin-nucleotide-binding protein
VSRFQLRWKVRRVLLGAWYGRLPDAELPGSAGEHALQGTCGTTRRARGYYETQMMDRLTPAMIAYIARQEMAFIATSDRDGECDSSFRAGPPGFFKVRDERTLLYPEFRGNGVMASLGNIGENPHIGILFVDFYDSTVGLHVNGRARIVANDAVDWGGPPPTDIAEAMARKGGQKALMWVETTVEEAYIHCSKHVPLLERKDKAVHWGTDDPEKKGADFFGARAIKKAERAGKDAFPALGPKR